MKRLKILFWTTFAKIWDLRPRFIKHIDYPIARCPISDSYDYSNFKDAEMKILFEWDEKGYHWIVFSR